MKKKILLVGLNYHDYTREIVEELRAQGHEVSFHDIQPPLPHLKLLRKFAKRRYEPALHRYHRGILAKEQGRVYDLVLFIQVHQMDMAALQEMRRVFNQAEFVLYNWDAVTNHDYRPYLRCFDRAYTFDPQDANELGIGYLPLFCIRAFLGLRQTHGNQPAVYVVGNIVNPRRYAAIHAFKRYCTIEHIPFRSYMMGSTHALGLLMRQGHWPSDVSLRSIAMPEFIDMVESSTAVFDFANHRQTGYTMRTIENLCAGKKIITNNPAIRDEPFFSEDRIHVFDGLDFSGVKDFLAQPLRDPDADFPEFHLSSFVRRLADSADTAGGHHP